jgi:hypothetical protein
MDRLVSLVCLWGIADAVWLVLAPADWSRFWRWWFTFAGENAARAWATAAVQVGFCAYAFRFTWPSLVTQGATLIGWVASSAPNTGKAEDVLDRAPQEKSPERSIRIQSLDRILNLIWMWGIADAIWLALDPAGWLRLWGGWWAGFIADNSGRTLAMATIQFLLSTYLLRVTMRRSRR